MNFKKLGAGALTLLFIAGSATVYAQVPQQQQQQQQTPQLQQQQPKTDVSEKDLQKFAKAYPEVQKKNQEAQEKMVKVIEKHGMKLERFNEIQTAKMQNQEVDMNKDEEKEVGEITDELDDLQPKLQKDVQDAATSTGLSVDEFQDIAVAIQSDQSLQQKLQKMMVADSQQNQQ